MSPDFTTSDHFTLGLLEPQFPLRSRADTHITTSFSSLGPVPCTEQALINRTNEILERGYLDQRERQGPKLGPK